MRLIKIKLQNTGYQKKKKWPWIVTGLIVLIIVFLVASYLMATAPKREAEAEAFKIAKKEKGIQSISAFYYYNGIKETYSVIVGPNKKNVETAVFIPRGKQTKKQHQVVSYPMSDGISEQEAKNIAIKEKQPQKILTTNIGMDEGTPIWEISYRKEDGTLNYFEINFITGAWYRQINNL